LFFTKVTEAQTLGLFAAYLSLSLVLDFLMLSRGSSEGVALFVILQVVIALLVLDAILRGIEEDAAFLADIFSFVYLIGIVGILAHGIADWWYPAVATFASWLESAVLTLLVHRTATLAVALTLSLAVFTVKLYSKDYRTASMMLFIAYIIALVLLFSAAI